MSFAEDRHLEPCYRGLRAVTHDSLIKWTTHNCSLIPLLQSGAYVYPSPDHILKILHLSILFDNSHHRRVETCRTNLSNLRMGALSHGATIPTISSESTNRYSSFPIPRPKYPLQATMKAFRHGAQRLIIKLEEAPAHVKTKGCCLRSGNY